jgi:bifunctional DNA-binding transcriptional regulator/antitoxin component of YhaV-PrlF toxin-antitoxin module
MRKTRHKITNAGQVSVPADVRRRWGTNVVSLEDQGDRLVLKPMPEDPIAAARGALRDRIPPTADLRARARRDGALAERRRG